MGLPGGDGDVRLAWLVQRAARTAGADPTAAVVLLAEALAVATGEAVTIRRLTDGGRSLAPVAVHHPDPVLLGAMREVTAATVEAADSGLWRAVLEGEDLVVVPVPADGPPPPTASATQRAFLARWPLRVVAGVGVRHAGRVLGGVSLLRFVDDRPFTDSDLQLLRTTADLVAPVLVGWADRRSPGDGDA